MSSPLYHSILDRRDDGDARRLWVRRTDCPHACWSLGAYEDTAGRLVVVARAFTLAPWNITQLEPATPVTLGRGIDVRIPGRAWLAGDVPEVIDAGCRHRLYKARVTPEPRVAQWDRVTYAPAERLPS